MQIFPAIDLSGGQVVRLYQGDYDKMTVYGTDPCAVARDFITAGAKYGDLYNAEITIDGETVKVGDYYDITVNGTAVTATDTTNVVAAGDEIVYTAKNAGARDEAELQQIAGSTGKITNGWDEGTANTSDRTEYTLSFAWDKLAGGQGFTINDKTFEISFGGSGTITGAEQVKIAKYNLDTEEGKAAALDEISDAIAAHLTDFDVSHDSTGTITMTAKSVTTGTNNGAAEITHHDNANTDAITSTYRQSTGTVNPALGVVASNTYSVNLDSIKVGDKLHIGNATVEVVEDNLANAAEGKFSVADMADSAKLSDYFNGILAKTNNDATAGDALKGANVKFDGNTVTVSALEADKISSDELAAAFGVSTTSVRDTETKVGGLVLQIGDTADDYNRLSVSIDDMHVKALGLEGISIEDPESAATAIDAIKEAINKVSMTRGTLGATQNRLEHTANNLSVMEENITDAESTIRDTDVADEMMAYTKNNILIQSAQAMLAQANAVPQGVLQLLQ